MAFLNTIKVLQQFPAKPSLGWNHGGIFHVHGMYQPHMEAMHANYV